jgi:hypothetical protein
MFQKTMVKNWSPIWTSQQPQQTTEKLAKTPSQRPKRKKTNKPKTSTSKWVREHEPKTVAKKLHKDQRVRNFFKKQTQKKQQQQQQINQQTNC